MNSALQRASDGSSLSGKSLQNGRDLIVFGRSCRFSVVTVCVIVFVSCGCSSDGGKSRPKLGKVKGTVTYKGKPVSGAAVTFMTEGAPRSATGITDVEGNFKLTTFDTNDGAVVGQHKVTVTKTIELASGKSASDMKPEDLAKFSKEGKLSKLTAEGIPAKYADPKSTPLKFTVEAGENVKTIDLED